MGMHISLGISFQCMLKVYFGKQMTGGCQSWGEICVHSESSERRGNDWALLPLPAKCKSFLAPGDVGKVPYKQFLLGMRFPVVSNADAFGGRGHTALGEGVEGIHIPLFSRRRQQSQNIWTRELALRLLCWMPCWASAAEGTLNKSSLSLSQRHIGTKSWFFWYQHCCWWFWVWGIELIGHIGSLILSNVWRFLQILHTTRPLGIYPVRGHYRTTVKAGAAVSQVDLEDDFHAFKWP